MKFKSFYLLMGLLVAFAACNNDDDGGSDFDAAAQAIIDDDVLKEYMDTHYYIPPADGEAFGKIDTILPTDNVTPLSALVSSLEEEYEDVNYKVYYYVASEGVIDNAPTRNDSTLVSYQGFLLDSTKFDERNNFIWFSGTQSGLRQGWRLGIENLKPGINNSVFGEPLSFTGTGKGVVLFPSGLGYLDVGFAGIPGNSPLIFHLNLAQVVKSDSDGDGLTNNEEDIDGNKEAGNDDTDGDRIPNFLDSDDDNDGRLTRDESKTEDADGDGVVDYLDPDS